MERKRRGNALLLCFLFAGLVPLSNLTPVACRSLEALADQKNYYPPDPHAWSAPSPKHKHKKPSCPTPSVGGSPTPSHGSGGSYGTPTPSHGSGGSYGGSGGSYGTPTPSHGSGGSYGGSGGSYGTPTPSHGSGGGYGTPTPSHGSGGSYGTPAPSHGSGGSYGTPAPSHGSGGYYNPSPSGGGGHSSPAIIPPPTTPVFEPPVIPTPTTPGISTPPSPLIPDPNGPPYSPGTCTYWSTHPAAIWGIFGYWGTVGGFLGAACTSAYGKDLSLYEALTNPRADGIGALSREGTAAFLNSMVCKKFPFTTQQVKNAFAAAVVSDKAAAAQAELFEQANEGRLKNH